MALHNTNSPLSVAEMIRKIVEEDRARRQGENPDTEIPPTPKWIIDHLAEYFTESDPEMVWGDEVYSEEIFRLLVLNMLDFVQYVWAAEKDDEEFQAHALQQENE